MDSLIASAFSQFIMSLPINETAPVDKVDEVAVFRNKWISGFNISR
jgi:hypothetical protein